MIRQIARPASSLVVADLNGNGNLDFAMGYGASVPGPTVVYDVTMVGSAVAVLPYNDEPRSVAVADLNRDGALDLAVGADQSSEVYAIVNQPMGAMPQWRTTAQFKFGFRNYGPAHLAIGDLNGDGIPDMATADGAEPTIEIMLGNGDGTFQQPVSISVGRYPTRIAIADLDQDQRNDIVVAYGHEAILSVLLNRSFAL